MGPGLRCELRQDVSVAIASGRESARLWGLPSLGACRLVPPLLSLAGGLVRSRGRKIILSAGHRVEHVICHPRTVTSCVPARENFVADGNNVCFSFLSCICIDRLFVAGEVYCLCSCPWKILTQYEYHESCQFDLKSDTLEFVPIYSSLY